MTIAQKRRISNARQWVSTIAIVLGLSIGGWAWFIARGATQENASDLAATNQGALIACQQGNRTRPQIAVNMLNLIDGVIEGFGGSIKDRRLAAQVAVKRLRPETISGGSIGQRDCTADGRIDQHDWYLGIPPPDLLGPDGLPHIKEPPP